MEIDTRITQFFSSLADETRLKIIMSIHKKSRNVNDIHKTLGEYTLTLSAVSHQLRQLSDAGIVKSDKKGREKIFSLSDGFCWCILENALGHFKSNKGCPKCSKIKR